MMGGDDRHSRIVAWLKIVLPLLALAVLSTLFLVSRTIDPSDAIPYAEVDIEDRIREPRITAPAYAGMTEDGAALTIAAAEARPGAGGSDAGSALALRAGIEMPDGGHAELMAATGRLDAEARLLRLEGGVEVATSTGYRVTASALTASLDRTEVQSTGALAATSPMGDLTAGSMLLTADADHPGTYLLVFKNGVKLLYEPAN